MQYIPDFSHLRKYFPQKMYAIYKKEIFMLFSTIYRHNTDKIIININTIIFMIRAESH